MAKRKSFTRQWWEERQRDRREHKRLEQARARHELAAERERRHQRRDEQRERDSADRRERAQAREQNRRDAEQKRVYEQILAEQGVARANARIADINAAVEALDAVLTNRRRDLAGTQAEIAALVDRRDVAGIGDLVQRVLAASPYTPSVEIACQAYYMPESSELLVDCELPERRDKPAWRRGWKSLTPKG